MRLPPLHNFLTYLRETYDRLKKQSNPNECKSDISGNAENCASLLHNALMLRDRQDRELAIYCRVREDNAALRTDHYWVVDPRG